MPIYEYRCQDCQNVFEEWLKNFNDDAPSCPSCGGQAERIMSNTTFVLKGGGWYVTEYGNKGDGGPVSAAHGDTAAGQGDATPATSATPAPASSAPSVPSGKATPAANASAAKPASAASSASTGA